MSDLLSQDEIDALLHGVDSGDVDTDDTEFDGIARQFDFASQDRIVRGRMPTLEMINERFARYFRITMFNMMRRSAEISVGGVQMLKFSEYIHSLFVPHQFKYLQDSPLRGTALCVFDPKLVFVTVDNYFGGTGRHAKIEGREFTPTEQRVISMMLNDAFHDLKEAWAPVLPVEYEFLYHGSESAVCQYRQSNGSCGGQHLHVELDGGGGNFQVVMPYSMLEPIRELLDAGVQSDRSDHDERWVVSLREEVKTAEVQMSATLAKIQVKLRDVLTMEKGDVIPFNFPEKIFLKAGGVPVFEGTFGESRGNLAIKIDRPVKRMKLPNDAATQALIAKTGVGNG